MTAPETFEEALARGARAIEGRAAALLEALRRLWSAVKERLRGPEPAPVKAPVAGPRK